VLDDLATHSDHVAPEQLASRTASTSATPFFVVTFAWFYLYSMCPCMQASIVIVKESTGEQMLAYLFLGGVSWRLVAPFTNPH